MPEEPANRYVEARAGGYCVAGTRVGLDVIVHEFESGKSPEAILHSYPSIGSLARIYGVITFILENLDAVERYLNDQDRLWKELQGQHPIPPDMLERFYRARELSRKSASGSVFRLTPISTRT